MADDPWTQDEIDELMDEWNGARQPQRKEKPVISEHGLKVYRYAQDCGGWFTIPDAAQSCDIGNTTAKHHLKAMADSGVLERMKMHPHFRFRLARTMTADAAKRATELEEACAVLAS